MDKDESIEYERMSLQVGSAEGSVGISKSKIPVESPNRKAWQPSGEPRDCDFYLYQRYFPETWCASMQ